MTRFEAGVTESPRAASERKWSTRWRDRVHIECMEESTKKAICAKKLKRLNIF